MTIRGHSAVGAWPTSQSASSQIVKKKNYNLGANLISLERQVSPDRRGAYSGNGPLFSTVHVISIEYHFEARHLSVIFFLALSFPDKSFANLVNEAL